jgi:protease-4
VVSIDTGKYKSAGLIGTEITPEQRQDFQRIVDAAMDDFVAAVSRGRGMTEQKVRQLGDGRIFTAPESVENGLVDTIATLDETMAERTRNAQHRRRRARAMALATGKRA